MSRYGVPRPTYPNLREVLDTPYASLPAAEIRSLMEGVYGAGAAEHYEEYFEGIFGDIGKALSKAAPVVANIGGGVLQGAMSGSSLGLPGIIAGAAAGGAGTALQSYGGRTGRSIGGALSGVTNLAGQFSPLGRVGASIGPVISGLAGSGGKGAGGALAGALGGLLGSGGSGASSIGGALGSTLGALRGRGGAGDAGAALNALSGLFGGGSAAGQLLSLLQRPETKKALAALKVPEVGLQMIPTGSMRTPLPVAAVPNLIKQLTDQVVAEAAGNSDGAESEPRYMMDADGEWVGDPALDRDRAARAWDLLNLAQAERLIEAVGAFRREAIDRADEAGTEDGRAERAADFYDGIDLVRSYFLPADDWESDFGEFDAEDVLGEDFTAEDYAELEEGEAT